MDEQPAPVVSWGELLWDEFPSGACLGGAPANVAFHLHQVGTQTTLITRLGRDDLGEKAKQALNALGLDLRGLQFDDVLPTGRVGIEIHEGEARYTLHAGAWQAIRCDDSARELLARCRAFCFGTLSQESERGLQSWREALSCLPKSALRVCDPNLRGSRLDAELLREHMQAADIVKINDSEAALMAKAYGQGDIVRWLLNEMKVSLVAQTHGAKGATLFSRESSTMHPGFVFDSESAERDNVGAGDSFVAVLLGASLAGSSLKQSVKAANRYACFVAGQRGATPEASAALLAEIDDIILGR